MNRMMKVLLAAGLAASSLSCVSDTVSIQIQNAIYGGVDEKCAVSDTGTQVGGGEVDLGWTRSYMLALKVASHLGTTDLKAGGETYSPTNRNDFNIDEVLLDYSGTGVPAIKPQTVKDSGIISAGGTLTLGMDILTIDSADALANAAVPDGGLVVNVGIRLSGAFANGAKFTTDTFNFPLTVFSSSSSRPVCDPAVSDTKNVDGTDSKPPCMNWGQDRMYCYCAPKKTGP